MTAVDGLEIGVVYRDPGDAEHPAVDFVVGRLEHETTQEGAPVLEVAHVQIGPSGGGEGPVMSHAPLERAVAAEAARERVAEADVAPAFDEGYAAWREAYEAGQAGVFSLAPSAVYARVLEMMARRGG